MAALRQAITTPNASPAVGHYSQAVVHNGETVYVSGLLPITPSGEKLASEPFDVQATQVMQNLKAILEAAGSSLGDVLSVRVYMADMEGWGEFNKVYTSFMGDNKPARAVVPIVPALPFGVKLELEAVAGCGGWSRL